MQAQNPMLFPQFLELERRSKKALAQACLKNGLWILWKTESLSEEQSQTQPTLCVFLLQPWGPFYRDEMKCTDFPIKFPVIKLICFKF